MFRSISVNTLKFKKEYLDYAYLGVFLILVLSFITGTLVSSIGYSMVVIDNPDPNSMWPTYFQGDLFILQDADPNDITIGDVIVYENEKDDKIIHRVIDVLVIDGFHYYRVKGDNPITNPPDVDAGSTLIKETSVLGKINFRIPYLGHLSLTMQRNSDIRYFIYFIAILLGIAIVFWPDEDKDEEKSEDDEFIEITTDIVKNTMKVIIISPITIFKNASTSKHKRIYTVITFTLLLLLFIPTIVPSFLSTANTPSGIGISGIEAGSTSLYSDRLNDQPLHFYFIQLKVTIYDNAGLWKRITGFAINVFTIKDNPDTLISSTKWKSLRDFKGSVTVGGSIVIHSEDQPADNTPLYVQIKLNSVEYFFEKTITEDYEILYLNP